MNNTYAETINDRVEFTDKAKLAEEEAVNKFKSSYPNLLAKSLRNKDDMMTYYAFQIMIKRFAVERLVKDEYNGISPLAELPLVDLKED